MASKNSVSEKVHVSFRQLVKSATDLNAASDELRDTILVLDATFKKLNLGVSAWVRIAGDEEPNGDYWAREVGYSKVGDTWGISLRKLIGNSNSPEDGDIDEVWSFNDAPRWMRVESIDKIPELLEALIKRADSTTQRIKTKTDEARELAAVMNAVSAEPESQQK